MRRDRALAALAFLLAVTAILLPWWRVAWDDGTVEVRDDVRAFRPEPPLTTAWGPWLTGGAAALAAGLLFLRLAADSHVHEPPAWRRDLAVAAGLLALAAASCVSWPADVPAFWGGRTYSAGGIAVAETARPGLGWWVGLLAAAAAGAAAAQARRRRGEEDGA